MPLSSRICVCLGGAALGQPSVTVRDILRAFLPAPTTYGMDGTGRLALLGRRAPTAYRRPIRTYDPESTQYRVTFPSMRRWSDS